MEKIAKDFEIDMFVYVSNTGSLYGGFSRTPKVNYSTVSPNELWYQLCWIISAVSRV